VKLCAGAEALSSCTSALHRLAQFKSNTCLALFKFNTCHNVQWSPAEKDVLCVGTSDGALFVLRVGCDPTNSTISGCSLSLIVALRLPTGSRAVSSLSWSPKGTLYLGVHWSLPDARGLIPKAGRNDGAQCSRCTQCLWQEVTQAVACQAGS
jgi:hypothetical protein